jgi:hypothetical protein
MVLCGVLATSVARAQTIDPGDISLYSTQDGGGALATSYVFDQKNLLFENLCAGGLCLYTSTDPGLISRTENEPADGLFALDDGTEVHIEVVSIDDAVTMKLGAETLDAAGQSALLGVVPDLHIHPEWQVTFPEGEIGDFPISFKLRQTGGTTGYADSEAYTLVLTNGSPAEATPTPNATASPGSTPGSSPTPGPAPTPAPTGGTARSGVRPVPGGLRNLISKDVGDQRWAITLNPDGTVTGNVFFPDGGPPSFVFCEEIGRVGKNVRLSCSGADQCLESPCLASAWTFIAEVELPLAFFEPPPQ